MKAQSANKTKVGVLGASGYTGGELVRLLSQHPKVEISLLTANRRSGKTISSVFPHLDNVDLPSLLHIDQVDWKNYDIDALFCALPHGKSQHVIADLIDSDFYSNVSSSNEKRTVDTPARNGVKIFDLSADFRLKDPELYKEWYKLDHIAPSLLGRSVYGLTEFCRSQIADTNLVSCPGCYPTSSLLPLVPLLQEGQVLTLDIIIDAKSGVSGAGREEYQGNLFSEVSEAIRPYGISGHRHIAEIEQLLSGTTKNDVTVTFTPHLVPMNRGILSTTYVRLADGVSSDNARMTLVDKFEYEPFVRVLDKDRIPATQMVRGTNCCVINVFDDRVPGRAIIISAIDNLGKGAAGQAIQNFNVSFGFKETMGLESQAFFP